MFYCSNDGVPKALVKLFKGFQTRLFIRFIPSSLVGNCSQCNVTRCAAAVLQSEQSRCQAAIGQGWVILLLMLLGWSKVTLLSRLITFRRALAWIMFVKSWHKGCRDVNTAWLMRLPHVSGSAVAHTATPGAVVVVLTTAVKSIDFFSLFKFWIFTGISQFLAILQGYFSVTKQSLTFDCILSFVAIANPAVFHYWANW